MGRWAGRPVAGSMLLLLVRQDPGFRPGLPASLRQHRRQTRGYLVWRTSRGLAIVARRPNPLPRSLRRAAARPAGPRGRVPSPALREAAAAGLLSRSNTEPGTAGRRAADAATYARRRAARPTAPARQAAGHVPAGSTGPVASFSAQPAGGGDPRLLVGVRVSRADVHRAGRYDSLVGQLAAGRITGATFERRVRGWRPVEVLGPPDVAGSWRFVADPGTALALAVEAAAAGIESWIDSGRSRPLPRLHRLPRRRS